MVLTEVVVMFRSRETGHFFRLQESRHTTRVSPVTTMAEADSRILRVGDRVQPPTYYFETSARMRDWLLDYDTIVVKQTTTTTTWCDEQHSEEARTITETFKILNIEDFA